MNEEKLKLHQVCRMYNLCSLMVGRLVKAGDLKLNDDYTFNRSDVENLFNNPSPLLKALWRR